MLSMLTTMFLCRITIQKSTHTHRALEHFKLSYDCNITRFIVSSRIPSIYTGCKYRRNHSSAVYLHVNSPCLPWIESWWKTNKWHDSVTITFSIDGIHTLVRQCAHIIEWIAIDAHYFDSESQNILILEHGWMSPRQHDRRRKAFVWISY